MMNTQDPKRKPIFFLLVISVFSSAFGLALTQFAGTSTPVFALESHESTEQKITVNIYIKDQSGNHHASKSPIDIVAEFSDAVKDFTIEDIKVEGAVLKGPPQPLDGNKGKKYGFQIKADMDGTITIIVVADAVHKKGDPNITNKEGLGFVIFESTGPTVSLSARVNPTSEDSIVKVKADFSEKIYNIDQKKITVTNGKATKFQGKNGDEVVTFNVKPDNIDGKEVNKVEIKLEAGFARDDAGKPTLESETLEVPLRRSELPAIFNNFSRYTGTIKFTSERMEGITTFVPHITIDFSDVDFGDDPPDVVRIKDTKGWKDFNEKALLTADLSNKVPGEQNQTVEFGKVSGKNPPAKEFEVVVEVFYLPNGDFEEEQLGANWKPDEDNLPVEVVKVGENGLLRLGHHHDDINFCDGVPEGSAIVQIDLSFPAEAEYQLHVEGTVYTYDQIPEMNPHLYDAFEVNTHVGDDSKLLFRKGNTKAGLSCDKPWTVPVDETSPLKFGVGEDGTATLTLSFENWSRLDNYYNTYTEINKIWVER